MSPPRVLVLGETLAVDASGIALPIGGPRRRAVLAFLALRAPRLATRAELVDALWGEAPPGDAANAVQAHVSALRRALGASAIATVGDGYRLADSVEVDVTLFDRLHRQGRRQLDAADPETASASLRAALAVWRGRALADLGTVAFARAAAVGLEDRRIIALETRFEADLAAGRPEETLTELEALLADHPLRESLAGLLMRARYAMGQQAGAFAVYAAVRERLRRDLGIEPSTTLRELHRRLVAGTEPLAMATVPRRRTTPVPVLLNETIGREADIDAVIRLVSGGSARLVTVLGPGGVGKTRVAVEVGRRLAGAFADDAVFVALTEAQRPDDVASVMCTALGLRPDSATAWSTVENELRNRRTLLICDNAEHVVAAAPGLARLLAAAPGVQVLVTSRQELGVGGEHQYWLDPLPHTVEDGSVSPAVSLFLARARAAGNRLVPTAADLVDIAAICAACDGLPLAIEIAAARLRVLGIGELRDRMARPLPLLTTGRSDAPPRHQTLRACIAASVDTLDPGDRPFLTALSVFRGGFTLDAASAVTGLPTGQTLDALDALVGRSLVQRTGPSDGRRFDLLQTIREFLAEESEPGTVKLARRRHAEYYHHRFGPVPDARSSVHTCRAWTALLPDRPNLRVAIRWAREEGEADLFADLVHAAAGMWERLGPREELEDWLEQCVTDPRATPDRVVDALIRRVAIGYHTGDLQRAGADLERASLLADATDELRRAWILLYQPWLRLLSGDLRGAAAGIEDARHAIVAAGSPVELRVYHLLLVASVSPAPDVGRAAHDELLSLALAHDLYPLTGTALNISCELDLEQGNYARVLAMAEIGLRITRDAGDIHRYGWIVSQRGVARLETGDLGGAVADLRASLDLAQTDSLVKGLEDVLRLAMWCARAGHHETCAVLLGIYEGSVLFVDSADSVLAARSRENDFADLPALLGAGYDPAIARGRAIAAAGPDRVLTTTLRILDTVLPTSVAGQR